jgi:hypothetical protein
MTDKHRIGPSLREDYAESFRSITERLSRADVYINAAHVPVRAVITEGR